jgi:hypothetical protein
MNTRRQGDPRRRTAIGAAVVVLGLLAAACGSSSTSTSSTTSSGGTGGGASATTTDLAQGCPFSGQTTPSSGTAQTQVATALTKVTPRKADCIDNVQFDFSPGVPAWSVGYQAGPFTDTKSGQSITLPGKYELVVQFQGVDDTYAGPTTVTPSSLNYVQQVTLVHGANGIVDWIVSLNQKLDYTTSTSSTPAYFVLAIG